MRVKVFPVTDFPEAVKSYVLGLIGLSVASLVFKLQNVRVSPFSRFLQQ